MDRFTPATIKEIDAIKDQANKRSDGASQRIGFTASCFDLLHPGHLVMLKEAREMCDYLVIALQTDPTIDRPDSKNMPVQTFKERKIMISAIRYVDSIIEYATEADLHKILSHLRPDIRILGTDWKGKTFTGHELDIPCFFHDRGTHTWSTSDLRRRIWEAEQAKRGGPHSK